MAHFKNHPVLAPMTSKPPVNMGVSFSRLAKGQTKLVQILESCIQNTVHSGFNAVHLCTFSARAVRVMFSCT